MRKWFKALLPVLLFTALLFAGSSASAVEAPVIRYPSRIIIPPTAADISADRMKVRYFVQDLGGTTVLNVTDNGFHYFIFYDADGYFTHMQVSTNSVTLPDGKKCYYDIYNGNPDDLTKSCYGGSWMTLHGILDLEDTSGINKRYDYMFEYRNGLDGAGTLSSVGYSPDNAYTFYYWYPESDDGWFYYGDNGAKTYADPGVEKRTDLIPKPTIVFTGETLVFWGESSAKDVLILPAGLEVIKADAFAGIAAQKVVIPDGCRTIEPGAFLNCPHLVEISLPSSCTLAANAVSANVTVTRR